MKVACWDSERDGPNAKTDGGRRVIKLDTDNLAIRLYDYAITGDHTSAVLFVGPNADANYDKWAEYCGDEDTTDDTSSHLVQCFG